MLTTPRIVATLVVFIIAALTESTAWGAVQSFCAQTDANFTDNNYGEDFWYLDDERELRGIKSRVRHYPDCANTGWNGVFVEYVSPQSSNGGGCVQFNATPTDACFLYSIWSEGSPDGSNTVKTYDSGGSPTYWVAWVDPPNGGGTTHVTFPEHSTLRVYATLSYLVYSAFRGGLSGKTLLAYGTDSSGTCGCSGSGNRWCESSSTTGRICLTSSSTSKKFVIAHEYGHHNLHFTAGDWTSDCSELPASCSGSHCMTGTEYQSCAMMEGWANFVSADAWNDDDENSNPDAYLRYWGDCDGSSTINVETSGADPDCVVAYMESTVGSASWPGHGTELDWMRTLWDHHTNDVVGHPGGILTHDELQDMFEGYLPQGAADRERSYDQLRLGNAANLSCTDYERIVYMADANGANHCENEGGMDPCENIPGCTDVD